MTAPSDKSAAYVILIPCFDDWESISLLLPLLDKSLEDSGVRALVLVIDDGSRTSCALSFQSSAFSSITQVEVLKLVRNLGHQRALCVGLCFLVHEPTETGYDGIVIMDADGEDSPEDVSRLIQEYRAKRKERAIFAMRARRSEGVVFSIFYALYRFTHRIITGIPVQIGNFSVLPLQYARSLTASSDLWNHYAAAVVNSRLPIEQVPTRRATRLRGESRMNFVALVSHGLSAMSVFADRIGVRALVFTLSAILVLIAGIGAVIGIRVFTTLAIPGWATTATGILALLLLQSLLFAIVFSFLIHLGRGGSGFLPARDFRWFIERKELNWRRPSGV